MNSVINILNEVLINWNTEENISSDNGILKINDVKNKITNQFGNYSSLDDWKNTVLEFDDIVKHKFFDYFTKKYPEYKEFINNPDPEKYSSTYFKEDNQPLGYRCIGHLYEPVEIYDEDAGFGNSDDWAYDSHLVCHIINLVAQLIGLQREDGSHLFLTSLTGNICEYTGDAFYDWDYYTIEAAEDIGKTNAELIYYELYNYLKTKSPYLIYDNLNALFSENSEIIKKIDSLLNEYPGTDCDYFIITDKQHKKFTLCFYVSVDCDWEKVYFIDYGFH